MSDIRFYHLQTQRLEQALPVILAKALFGDRRIIVRFEDEKQVRHFDEHLWSYSPDSFLPHGTEADGHASVQPVYLTFKNDNPNCADMLILCQHQTVPENIAEFALCCDFIDGQNDDAVATGRTRWKAYKDAGYNVTYYQQTESGGWDQKV